MVGDFGDLFMENIKKRNDQTRQSSIFAQCEKRCFDPRQGNDRFKPVLSHAKKKCSTAVCCHTFAKKWIHGQYNFMTIQRLHATCLLQTRHMIDVSVDAGASTLCEFLETN